MNFIGWGLEYSLAGMIWFFMLNGLVWWRGRKIPEGGQVAIVLLSAFLGVITVVTNALLF